MYAIRSYYVNGGIVIDFLNFGIGGLRTGILNVADLSVTFGALAFILMQFFAEKNKQGIVKE